MPNSTARDTELAWLLRPSVEDRAREAAGLRRAARDAEVAARQAHRAALDAEMALLSCDVRAECPDARLLAVSSDGWDRLRCTAVRHADGTPCDVPADLAAEMLDALDWDALTLPLVPGASLITGDTWTLTLPTDTDT